MANPEHLKILKRGVEVWNKWREDNPKIVPDLSEGRIDNEDLSSRISLKIKSTGIGFDYARIVVPNFNKVNLSTL